MNGIAELTAILARAKAPHAKYPKPSRRVINGRHMADDTPLGKVCVRYTPKLATAPRVLRCLADGRYRSLDQIVVEGEVKRDSAYKALRALCRKGQIEVLIIANRVLFGLAHFQG